MAVQLWQVYAIFLFFGELNVRGIGDTTAEKTQIEENFKRDFRVKASDFLSVLKDGVGDDQKKIDLRQNLNPDLEKVFFGFQRWLARKPELVKVTTGIADGETTGIADGEKKKEKKQNDGYLNVYKQFPFLMPAYDNISPEREYCSGEMPEFLSFLIDVRPTTTIQELAGLLGR